jgi:hypothetical protein
VDLEDLDSDKDDNKDDLDLEKQINAPDEPKEEEKVKEVAKPAVVIDNWDEKIEGII